MKNRGPSSMHKYYHLLETPKQPPQTNLHPSHQPTRTHIQYQTLQMNETFKSKSPFPHPWWNALDIQAPAAYPLNHWIIHDISNSIRSKTDWRKKYKDIEIVKKWREEVQKGYDKSDDTIMDSLFDYTLKEIKWIESVEDEHDVLIECDLQVVSSRCVSDELRLKLVEQAQQLYDSFKQLDYHPGSNNQVIDLVHPSLFPVMYGTTVIRTESGLLQLHEYDPKITKFKPGVWYGDSKRFQWLPSVMTLDPETKKFEYSSYINNLHPIQFKEMYTTLSEIFNASIPALNYCLSRVISPPYERIPGDRYLTPYKHENGDYYYDTGIENFDEEFWNKRLEFLKEPRPDPFKPPLTTPFDITSFKHLKIITKLANIELTPDNPVYAGGSWHLEGTINEDIIATVIYYYGSKNITESRLSFRSSSTEPVYEQDDDVGCQFIYGLAPHADELLVRRLGDVSCDEGKMVVWPNGYQHHVDSFELKDKTTKGERKIVCFFLCDPYNDNVVASDVVPYQRQDWWEDDALKMDDDEKRQIMDLQDKLPIAWEDACEVRQELMKERSANDDDDSSFNYKFSLCEH